MRTAIMRLHWTFSDEDNIKITAAAKISFLTWKGEYPINGKQKYSQIVCWVYLLIHAVLRDKHSHNTVKDFRNLSANNFMADQDEVIVAWKTDLLECTRDEHVMTRGREQERKNVGTTAVCMKKGLFTLSRQIGLLRPQKKLFASRTRWCEKKTLVRAEAETGCSLFSVFWPPRRMTHWHVTRFVACLSFLSLNGKSSVFGG